MAQIRTVKGKKGITYRVVIRRKGFADVYKSFDKKNDAKEWAAEVELLMKKGKWSKVTYEEVATPILTVKELIEVFIKNKAQEYSKPEQYTHMYNWWIEKIGHLTLSELDSMVLIQCQNILINEAPSKKYKNHEKKSNNTVRKYMFALSAVLKYGVKMQLLDRNPMGLIDLPTKGKGVVRFLSDDERKTLFRTCKTFSDLLYLFAKMAVFTGGRYSELRGLTIENIDFVNEMIFFLDTKNGESRGVPVYHKLMNELKAYLEKYSVTSGYVFVNIKTKKLPYIKGVFEAAIKAAGLKNFRIHDCRHSYASYLAANGATLLEIAELMGHKNLQQVQIYSHLTVKTTSKLVRKMSANLWDDYLET